MVIYAADDEQLLLDTLCEAIRESVPDADLHSFTRASLLLSTLSAGAPPPDVAFLDIEMPGMTGLELAKRIKQLTPHANIVFITGYSQYALEAMSLRPSGYVMKPATKEKILAELANLRNPPARTVADKRVRVQCFGNFEVFIDGAPLRFERSRTREVLAYLVDRRGAACNTAEICAAIWEDASDDSATRKQFRKHMSDLTHTLKDAGIAHMLNKGHNSFAIVQDTFDCDYYDYLANSLTAINAYRGEYMTQYSWAEITHSTLQ